MLEQVLIHSLLTGLKVLLHVNSTSCCINFNLQWNPSNPDTLGAESIILIVQVSSFHDQGLEMYYNIHISKVMNRFT